MIRLVHGAATHLGLVRRQNEDSFVATDGLYAVCDGMGGARAGEVASEAACRILVGLPTGAGAEDLRQAVTEANAVIRERSLADKALAGMGTTLTAATARGSRLTLAQVGDSRAYLWHDGSLRQVTQDHSLVAEMIRQGQLTPEQAAVHPHRSIITRALGTEASVVPDIFDLPLEAGDRVLLCSDGLSGMVSNKELARIAGSGTHPQGVADALVAAALRHGGEDNVTVVVIFAVEGEGEKPAADGSAATAPTDPTETPSPRPGPRDASDSPPPDDLHVQDPDPTADIPSEDDATARRSRMRAGEASAEPPSAGPVAGLDGFGPLVRTSTGTSSARRRPSRRAVLIGLAVVAAVLVLAFGAFLAFNSTVYFVGTTEGQVALFQGMPYAVMGIDLYSAVVVVPVRFDALDTYLQARVDAHELVTKEEGLRFIRGLQTPQ
ncbi:MAG: Stp1/IreP family PP2C-type Ser/Thr phosphatase [Thermoleophilia bacterium]